MDIRVQWAPPQKSCKFLKDFGDERRSYSIDKVRYKLGLNLISAFCFCLPNAGRKEMSHYSWLLASIFKAYSKRVT